MLSLSRKVGETIRIGDDIEVIVKSISRGRVMLVVNAPKDVPVHREEIYLAIQRGEVHVKR